MAADLSHNAVSFYQANICQRQQSSKPETKRNCIGFLRYSSFDDPSKVLDNRTQLVKIRALQQALMRTVTLPRDATDKSIHSVHLQISVFLFLGNVGLHRILDREVLSFFWVVDQRVIGEVHR